MCENDFEKVLTNVKQKCSLSHDFNFNSEIREKMFANIVAIAYYTFLQMLEDKDLSKN